MNMKLSAKSYLLLAIGLLAASIAAAQSFAIANQLRMPARSLGLGLPFDGMAKASFAAVLQTTRITKDPTSQPTKREVRLAREALSSEPLATSALPILIQSFAGEGKEQEAQRLLSGAGKLTRRDNLINAMLIDEALQKKDDGRAVLLLGRAMTVSYKIRDLYVGRMAAATVSSGALEALPPILGRNPKWAETYWNTVANNGSLIPNGAKVRLRIAGPPWNLNKADEVDFRMIRSLANLDPAMSFDLSRALGLQAPVDGEILLNSNFSRQPRFVPLDWDLLQSGDIGASIEPQEGGLVLSSLPASSGVAARQLVHIAKPGRYHLQWKISGLANADKAALKFRLSCTDKSRANPIAPIALAEGSGSASIQVGETACEWYWATLELDTPLGAAGLDVSVRRLSLRSEGRS